MDYFVSAVPLFMIVFIRIASFIAFVPFFNDSNFIVFIKIALAMILAFLLFPTLSTVDWSIPVFIPDYLLFLLQESIVGLIMGLTVLILLFAPQFIGLLLGFQMAFSMARAVDFSFGGQSNILSIFLVVMGTVLFLSLGGDHYLILMLNRSFSILKPGSIFVSKGVIDKLSELIMNAFSIGFRIVAPAIIMMLCISLTLGLIGKTSSKMQIFFVGLPLKIAIGLIGFTLVIGFILTIWGKEVKKLPLYLLELFYLLRI